MLATHRAVAVEGPHEDEGAECDQRHGEQSVQRRPAGNRVQVDVVEDRAADQREDDEASDRERNAVTPGPALGLGVRGGRCGGGGHDRATTTNRRPRTSTGTPSWRRSTTNV